MEAGGISPCNSVYSCVSVVKNSKMKHYLIVGVER